MHADSKEAEIPTCILEGCRNKIDHYVEMYKLHCDSMENMFWR